MERIRFSLAAFQPSFLRGIPADWAAHELSAAQKPHPLAIGFRGENKLFCSTDIFTVVSLISNTFGSWSKVGSVWHSAFVALVRKRVCRMSLHPRGSRTKKIKIKWNKSCLWKYKERYKRIKQIKEKLKNIVFLTIKY